MLRYGRLIKSIDVSSNKLQGRGMLCVQAMTAIGQVVQLLRESGESRTVFGRQRIACDNLCGVFTVSVLISLPSFFARFCCNFVTK